MIEQKQIDRISEELDTCKRPLFFFHDDADGLSSFLLLYRRIGEGKGVIVKTTPRIDRNFTRRVREYVPDKVFILDIAMVEQDFLDDMAEMGLKVVWIDHHNPLKRENVLYFNPRLGNAKDDTCVTRICYDVVKNDVWIAMIGSLGDWQMPEFKEEFIRKYPSLLDEAVERPEDAIYGQRIGEFVKIFSFVLKGKTEDVVKCMKILTRISDPYEILEEKTPAGRFILKKYKRVKEHYDALLKKAKERIGKEDFFVFVYTGEKFSFSSEIANELLYTYPTKIIFAGRIKSGEIKYSIRSSGYNLQPLVKKALEGVEGFGGGHEHACGAVIKEKSNQKFIEQFKKDL